MSKEHDPPNIEERKLRQQVLDNTYKFYFEQRNDLEKRGFKLIMQLNRTLIVLCTGGIGLSMTLVGSMHSEVRDMTICLTAWILWGFCISLCLLANYLDFIVITQRINKHNAEFNLFINQHKWEKMKMKKWPSIALAPINIIIGLSFLSGIFFFGLFVWRNTGYGS